jgi:two-component system, OmpR family, phosphate regulon sensor histidine kinase PhoR
MNNIVQLPVSAARARNRDLKHASDFQLAILGMAGHDLRQPLQTIQSTYDLLRARGCSRSDQVLLERGEAAIGRLTEQFDRLLDAARVHEYAKRMEFSPVALAPLFWRLVHENEDAALRRGIDMRACLTTAHVASNAVLLGGILRNLLTNAIRYTEPGGRILIGCRRIGSDIRIDVYDTGIGIAPERLDTIFDAAAPADTTLRKGLGMGLFIVRRALEVLGHRIEIKSTVREGSRFSVFAPRAV